MGTFVPEFVATGPRFPYKNASLILPLPQYHSNVRSSSILPRVLSRLYTHPAQLIPSSITKMKPRASFAVLVALWLFHEAQARRISKFRISYQSTEPTKKACVTRDDAEPNVEACITRSVQHETTTVSATGPGSTSPSQVEVIASDDPSVCMEAFCVLGCSTNEMCAGGRISNFKTSKT